MLTAATFFKEQVSETIFVEDIFFGLASISLLFLVTGIGLIDAGLVRRKNLLGTWIQKLVAALVAGGSFLIIGYAIWNWQYFEAFGVPEPLKESINAWWLGGTNMTNPAHNLDPAVAPSADVFQIFAVFFFSYAAVLGALIHSAGLERIRSASLYVMAAVVGGVVMPFTAYLTWGSVSPLTNAGVHDYLGIFSCYVFVGAFALVLAWRVGPRLGESTPDPRTSGPYPHNMGLTATGVALILFCVPFLALGCGFIVPDAGYFGISMTESGFGLVMISIFAAYFGGVVTGGVLSYMTRNPLYVLIGPVAGYISCAATLDIADPWVNLLIAMGGPFAFWLVYTALHRLKIDEHKIVPLGLGCGTWGVIMSGLVGWGTKTGGFFALEGKYGFQNSEINLGWQMLAWGCMVVAGVGSALILCFLLEKTIGLRVPVRTELKGMDDEEWNIGIALDNDLPVFEEDELGVGTPGGPGPVRGGPPREPV